jgi:beta-lactamase class A
MDPQKLMRAVTIAVVLAVGLAAGALAAGPLERERLQAEFERLVGGFDGRAGVCARDAGGLACVNGGQRFSMQSVVKLAVGVAVMDAVDRGAWRLEDEVTVRREDLSLFVQPIAERVTAAGFRTTVDDLVRRAVVDSDSAATDVLIARLGGPGTVQAALTRLGVRGIRVDRDERHLQTEILALTWRPEFVDAMVLDAAIAAVPPDRRDQAWRRYKADARDTSTPQAMVELLHRLATRRLLSGTSTARLLAIMKETVTFPDRLKAGLAPGWSLGHKTGTSGSWRGETAATNDVGILFAPDGTAVSIAVFVADSKASGAQRNALIANLARATVAGYR